MATDTLARYLGHRITLELIAEIGRPHLYPLPSKNWDKRRRKFYGLLSRKHESNLPDCTHLLTVVAVAASAHRVLGHPGAIRRSHIELAIQRDVEHQGRLASVAARPELLANLCSDARQPDQPGNTVRAAGFALLQ